MEPSSAVWNRLANDRRWWRTAPVTERAARIAAVAIGGVLFVTAVGKGLDPTAPYPMIESVLNANLSNSALFSIVAAAAVAEALLAALLWSNVWPRLASWALVGLMAGFTVITTMLVLDPSAPPCGCSGGPKLLDADAQAANQLALGRNVVLLAGSGWICVVAMRRGRRVRGRGPGVRRAW